MDILPRVGSAAPKAREPIVAVNTVAANEVSEGKRDERSESRVIQIRAGPLLPHLRPISDRPQMAVTTFS